MFFNLEIKVLYSKDQNMSMHRVKQVPGLGDTIYQQVQNDYQKTLTIQCSWGLQIRSSLLCLRPKQDQENMQSGPRQDRGH